MELAAVSRGDLVGRYPSQLPDDLLARQMRELTDVIASELGVRPVSYRAGRHGFDARNLHELEWLGYTVDSSVNPLRTRFASADARTRERRWRPPSQ